VKMVDKFRETKIFSNSIFDLKNRLYFSKNNKENIHRDTTVFTPIFILNELTKFPSIETEDRNLYNIKYEYENRVEHRDLHYDNYKTRIMKIHEHLKKFLENTKKVLKEEDNEELYKFIKNTNLISGEEVISLEEFELLFKKLYKLILSINYYIIKSGKMTSKEMNETFSSLLEVEILDLKKENPIYNEGNFVANVKFVKDEIYKRFMFNDLNLKFYNLLIDLQLLSIDEILYTGFDEKNKIIVLKDTEDELEKKARQIFYDCIEEIDTKRIRFLTNEYPIENLEQNFNFEYFDKLKSMDIINVNFEISDDIKEEVEKHIKTEEIEKIKYAIVCQLLEKNLIDNSKKNILKNIKVIGVKAKEDDKHESGMNNIVYIRLPKIDLEIKLELELVVKVFSRSDRLIFQYSEKRIVEKRLQNLEFFQAQKQNISFKILTINKSEYFVLFSSYIDNIKKSGLLEKTNLRFESDKTLITDMVKSVLVNPVNVEIAGKFESSLGKYLLQIYLYIYMQCLFILVKEKESSINDFKEFIRNLKDINVDTVRMKMLKYINYFYYSRYNLREKFEINKRVSEKTSKTFKEVEKIINNNYDYLFLSKLVEFIYLQIINILYINNVINVEYVDSKSLRKILKLDENGEKEFIRNIIKYFGKYKDEFKEDFDFMFDKIEKIEKIENKN
jgi:hypothetical protein